MSEILCGPRECYEIVSTNYANPDVTSGQHTNGPAAMFVRLVDATQTRKGKWINTGETHAHKVRKRISEGEFYGRWDG